MQFGDPAEYPPLVHGARILAESGVSCTFLGVFPRAAHRPRPEIPRASWHMYEAHRGRLRRWLTFLWMLLLGTMLVVRLRPRWIYVSDAFMTPFAWLAKVLLRRRVIYHEHDLPGREGRAEAFFAAARLRAMRAVDLVVVPNEERGEWMRREAGLATAPLYVPNHCAKAQAEVPLTRPAQAETLDCIYQGSVAVARLPMSVVDAFVETPGVRLHVVCYAFGPVAEAYCLAIKRRFSDRNVSEKLVFHGELPHDEVLTVTRKCHLGLAFFAKPGSGENPNLIAMFGASNKVSEYLAAGLSVLVSDVEPWQSAVADHDVGVAVDPQSKDAVRAVLTSLVADPDRLRRQGENGRRLIREHWNYEAAFAPVATTILGA